MLREAQIAQAKKLLAHLQNRTTDLADNIYRNPVTDYTCPDQAERERQLLFRELPINIGLSCLLPAPGDWMTHDYAGIPILLVRREDGTLVAFLNVCRHRGARVAEDCGSAAKSFSCPYHGWTYGLDGSLIARPAEAAFFNVERATHGLRPLPVVEKYGMIWVATQPDLAIDVDAMLGGAVSDIAAYRLDTYRHFETRVLERKINWKLAVDTFGETYHLGYLHPTTVSPIFHTDRATFDAFGRNHRMIGARRTIQALHDQPEEAWDVFDHTVMLYVLFPNTVFAYQRDHIETWHMFPGDTPDSCRMYVSLYIPEPITSESAKRHWDKNFDLLMATVEYEDFPTCEGMQKGFLSGAQDAIVFGRNEPALQHFHKNIRAALAQIQPAMAAE